MTLWHYTCDHAAAEISTDGWVRPARMLKPSLGEIGAFAWFTDLDPPVASALGLDGTVLLSCDRTAHRFRVTDDQDVVPWVSVRRDHRWLAAELESHSGAMPMHWFVSAAPVPVEPDPRA